MPYPFSLIGAIVFHDSRCWILQCLLPLEELLAQYNKPNYTRRKCIILGLHYVLAKCQKWSLEAISTAWIKIALTTYIVIFMSKYANNLFKALNTEIIRKSLFDILITRKFNPFWMPMLKIDFGLLPTLKIKIRECLVSLDLHNICFSSIKQMQNWCNFEIYI